MLTKIAGASVNCTWKQRLHLLCPLDEALRDSDLRACVGGQATDMLAGPGEHGGSSFLRAEGVGGTR